MVGMGRVKLLRVVITILTVIVIVNSVSNTNFTTGQQAIPIQTIQSLIEENDAIEISINGTSSGQNLGNMITGLGDINNDGYDDFITGSPGANGDNGEAYIIYGRQTWSNMSVSDVDRTIISDSSTYKFGSDLANIGDVDQDGSPDFAISWFLHDDGSGSVFLFSAASINDINDPTSHQDLAFASFTTENIGDMPGHGISGAGDVNNDGYDDFLISSEFNDDGGTDAGKVYLAYGGPSGTWGMNTSLGNANASFIGGSSHAIFGMDVRGVGDINNDGYSDFAITSKTNSLRTVSIFLGKSTPWEKNVPASSANITITLGLMSNILTWKHLAGNVDVNNDGYDDVIIGSYTEVDSQQPVRYRNGKTFLLLGKETSELPKTIDKDDLDGSLIGITTQRTGWSASGLNDINNDGYDEILTSEFTPQTSNSERHVHIILGRQTSDWSLDMNLSTHAAMTISSGTGDQIIEGFGHMATDVGDVNGDGIHDIAINKFRANSGAGGLYLVLDATPIPFTSTGSTDSESEKGDSSFFTFSIIPVFSVIVVVRKYRLNSVKN
jgi:hypothetical protein